MASDQSKTPNSWSADGRFLLYHSIDPTDERSDLWVVPMVGDRTPSVFLKTPFREAYGAFSPDGRWVAYQSNESGRIGNLRAAVCPARRGGHGRGSGWGPVAGVHGGRHPSRLAARRQGAVLPQPGGRDDGGADHRHRVHARTGRAGRCSFPRASSAAAWTRQQGRQYDVAPDGRFLINTVLDSAAAPITLLQNWNPEAKK